MVALSVNVATADTLEIVKQRGYLRCGITEANPGFSSVNSNGERIGFDIDQCKTIAVAVFGEAKVEYIPLTATTAFLSVQSGGVDMFAGGATWTYTRDAS